jgi:hypothetical protein
VILTPVQRRAVRRINVGSLDDGRRAFPARHHTEEVARAVFEAYDPELVFEGKVHAEWCFHNAQYAFDHGCPEWCENPSSTFVWTARYPKPAQP